MGRGEGGGGGGDSITQLVYATIAFALRWATLGGVRSWRLFSHIPLRRDMCDEGTAKGPNPGPKLCTQLFFFFFGLSGRRNTCASYVYAIIVIGQLHAQQKQ